jgi:hypothetical protein
MMISLNSGQIIPNIKSNNFYKYLGIYENTEINTEETWKINFKKYLQRVWLIFSTNASSYYKIRAVNTFANPKLMYIQWVLTINRSDLREADVKTRNIMIRKGALSPGSSIPLLYIDRKNGGRGLRSIEDNYVQCKIKVSVYLYNNKSSEIQELLKIEKGRKQKSLIEQAIEYSNELGLTLKQDQNKKWGIVKPSKEEGEEIMIFSLKEISTILNNKIQEKYLSEIKNKNMAGLFFEDFRNIENFNKNSYSWLTSWKGIPTTLERKIFEAFEQLTNTKYRRKDIKKESIENNICRLCHKKKETVRHILSNCDRLATGLYITRHNSALKVIYWWLLHKYKFEEKLRYWDDPEKPKPVISNKDVTIKWNVKISTNDYTEANKPDMTLINHKKKQIILIEMSCPWDKNINNKTQEKKDKYQELRQQLREQYEGYIISQSNIIVGTFATITTIEEEIKKISKKATKLISQIQRVVLINSVSIIEKFLKRE